MKRFWQTFFKYWVKPWAPFMLLIAPIYADDNQVYFDGVQKEKVLLDNSNNDEGVYRKLLVKKCGRKS